MPKYITKLPLPGVPVGSEVEVDINSINKGIFFESRLIARCDDVDFDQWIEKIEDNVCPSCSVEQVGCKEGCDDDIPEPKKIIRFTSESLYQCQKCRTIWASSV